MKSSALLSDHSLNVGLVLYKSSHCTKSLLERPAYGIVPPSTNKSRLYMQKGFLVEQFGRVRTHQSPALNFHLEKATEAFDQEYRKTAGPLGTAQHRFDRYEFQRSVANTLLDLYRNDDGDPARIRTATKITVNNGLSRIGVESESKFQQPQSAPNWLQRVLG
jgi:hypothetical protein